MASEGILNCLRDNLKWFKSFGLLNISYALLLNMYCFNVKGSKVYLLKCIIMLVISLGLRRGES